MREILFRGKRKDNGEWIEGSLLIYNDIVALDPDAEPTEYWIMGDSLEHVIPETVGQYTGLKDKNGKKIFEGDVLECPGYSETRFGVVMTEEWQYACPHSVYGFATDGDVDLSTHPCCEIVGNIHDNPEWLEVEWCEQ